MNFDQCFIRLLGNEGQYSNNPADSGGETMWGVTKLVARASGYAGEMKNLTQAQAAAIYRSNYWLPMRLDQFPDYVRFTLFDAAVNSGCNQTTKWLQRALYVDDDGVIGPVTLAAAQKDLPEPLLRRFLGQRLMGMTDFKGWPDFGKGWARRLAKNLIEP